MLKIKNKGMVRRKLDNVKKGKTKIKINKIEKIKIFFYF